MPLSGNHEAAQVSTRWFRTLLKISPQASPEREWQSHTSRSPKGVLLNALVRSADYPEFEGCHLVTEPMTEMPSGISGSLGELTDAGKSSQKDDAIADLEIG